MVLINMKSKTGNGELCVPRGFLIKRYSYLSFENKSICILYCLRVSNDIIVEYWHDKQVLGDYSALGFKLKFSKDNNYCQFSGEKANIKMP